VQPIHAQRAPASTSLGLRYALFALASIGSIAFNIAWPWHALLTWVGLANAWVAVACFRGSATMFGKRADGQISALHMLVMLPYLALVWTFFALKLAGLRKEPCWQWVAPGIYLGRKPRAGEVPADVATVVDLTCEFPENAQVVKQARYVCLPMLNRHVPSDDDFARLIADLVHHNAPLYIHCGAGRGRSAMVAAALLIQRGLASDVEQAEAMLVQRRPGVALHPCQRLLIDRHAAATLRAAQASESQPAFAQSMCA
jgi:protein-tyrosine phosphatase